MYVSIQLWNLKWIKTFKFLQDLDFFDKTWITDRTLPLCHTASIHTPENREEVHEIKVGFLPVLFYQTNNVTYELGFLYMIIKPIEVL